MSGIEAEYKQSIEESKQDFAERNNKIKELGARIRNFKLKRKRDDQCKSSYVTLKVGTMLIAVFFYFSSSHCAWISGGAESKQDAIFWTPEGYSGASE